MADPLWVRDTLVEDVVEAQKSTKGSADAVGASEYIVQILEKMDRKAADSKPKTASSRPTKKPGAVEKEFERRTGKKLHPGWTKTRSEGSQPKKLVQLDEVTRVGRARLAARLRWMRGRPDLRREVEAVAPFLHSAKADVRERAANKLRALLEKSDRLAGHSWMKPPPRKLFF